MVEKANTKIACAPSRLMRFVVCAALVVPAVVGLSSEAIAGITIFESVGANPAAITPTRDDFRSAVGGGNVAAANGDFGGLRREINWDGVGAGFSDPNLLPGAFFNTNSPRGAVFSTPGTGFLVSGVAPVTTLFGFPGDLQTFSAQKLFAIVGSNQMDIRFFVPGTNTAATTSAFAAIFVDVEDNNLTKMQFFDPLDNEIFNRTAAVGGNQGLSFLGGVANAGEKISRVRLTMPENFLVSNGVRANESVDFVIMDDFLYATPSAVPEPGIWAMTLMGLALVAWRSRRRR